MLLAAPQKTLGFTKNGTPRVRREKLSPVVRKIEHNVRMHIKRDVRHTGRGWIPLFLDPAWDMALKRLIRDGLVEERPELGGYVPTEFVGQMLAQNSAVLQLLKLKFKANGYKPVVIKDLGREKACALGRLVVSGLVDFDAQTAAYTPLEAL